MGKLGECLNKLKSNGLLYCIAKVIEKAAYKTFGFVYRKKELDNIIVIESHNDFDCNGGAFYDYLIENKYNEKYKIVWMLKHKLDRELPSNVFAYEFKKLSLKKIYYSVRAKYVLCEDYFLNKCRADQITVYCTHGGVTFKNVKGLIVVPEYLDYILSASENYDPLICKNYSIKYPNNRMLHFGYPSHDVFFKDNSSELEKVTSKKFKKSILWMPTFRTSLNGRSDSTVELPLGLPLFDTIDQLLELDNLLKTEDAMLILKLHPKATLPQELIDAKFENIFVLTADVVKKKNIDVYRLMSASDALISDYSSSAYSYLLLNRPIGFVLSDIENYTLGFSVENYEDFLPGMKIFNYCDFSAFVDNVINQKDDYVEQRENVKNWIYEYDDGNTCKRLVEFLKI